MNSLTVPQPLYSCHPRAKRTSQEPYHHHFISLTTETAPMSSHPRSSRCLGLALLPLEVVDLGEFEISRVDLHNTEQKKTTSQQDCSASIKKLTALELIILSVHAGCRWLTVSRAVLLVVSGVTRTSELTLSRPSSPHGDQTVLSRPNSSVLR